MKWKLKASNAKSAKSVCVIKVSRPNLTGSFMKPNSLGNNEYSYSPESVGIYRVMHNVDRSEKPIKGCYLVYQLENEDFLRYLSISDDQVRDIPEASMTNSQYIINLAQEIRAQFA